MATATPDYLKFFGEIKFAEEKSWSANDFETSLTKHFSEKPKVPSGQYKIAELDNKYLEEFGDFLIGNF